MTKNIKEWKRKKEIEIEAKESLKIEKIYRGNSKVNYIYHKCEKKTNSKSLFKRKKKK